MHAKVSDIPDKEYFALKAVDQSQLKQFIRNPAEWGWSLLHPEHDPTPAMQFGTAFHAFILNNIPVVSLDEGESFQSKENRAWRDEQVRDGNIVVSWKELQLLRRMRANLERYPEYLNMIETGTAEVCIQWADKETGLPLKAKPDLVPADKDFLVDLKTASSAKADDFMRESFKFGYHIQAQFYRQAVAMCRMDDLPRGKKVPDAMQFWVFEKTGACDWSPYSISGDNPMAENANVSIRQAIRGIADMVRRGEDAGLGEGLEAGARWACGGDGRPDHGYSKRVTEVKYSDWLLLRGEEFIPEFAS